MQIKGFTIIELAAALFISSLLASFAYITFGHLNQNIGSFSRNSQVELEWKKAEWVLNTDLLAATKIIPEENTLTIWTDRGLLNYELYANGLIRKSDIRDTLVHGSLQLAKHWSADHTLHLVLTDTLNHRIDCLWSPDISALKNLPTDGH